MNSSALNNSRILDASAPTFVPKSSNSSISRKNSGPMKKERSGGATSPSLHKGGASSGKVGKGAKGGGNARARQPRGRGRGRGGHGGSRDRRQKQALIDEFFADQGGDYAEETDFCPDTQHALAASLMETSLSSSGMRQNRSRSGRASANHLLNFQYESPARGRGARRGGNGGGGRRKNSQPVVHVSKEQFLQASFRFMVYPEKNPDALQEAFIDPDVLVDWDTVEQVVLFSDPSDNPVDESGATQGTGLPNCPVCLDQPRVPKITQCGHIFCVVCLLRHLGGEASKRCPMCFEQVSGRELRAVSVRRNRTSMKPGVWVDLPLLRRKRHALSPSFAEKDKIDNTGLPGTSGVFVEGDPRGRFSRIVVSHPERVCQRLEEERKELLEIKEEFISWDETEYAPFCLQALNMLSQRQRFWLDKDPANILLRFGPPREEEVPDQGSGTSNLPDEIFTMDGIDLEDPLDTMPNRSQKEDVRQMIETDSSEYPLPMDLLKVSSTELNGDAWGSPDEEGLLNQDLDILLKEEDARKDVALTMDMPQRGKQEDLPQQPKNYSRQVSSPADEYSFYQIIDGQWAFLHPLNMRCLLEEAKGNAYDLPPKLHAKILEVETHRLTSELRRRLAFLGHLPEHCLIHFLELDLQAHLGDATLKVYGSEIKKRHLARKKKERQQAKLRREEAKENLAHQALVAARERDRNRTIDLHGPLPSEAATGTSPPSSSSLVPPPPPNSDQVEDAQSSVLSQTEGGQNSAVGSPGEGWTFSRVTSSGYFPTLGEIAGQQGPKSSCHDAASTQPAWGSAKKGNDSSPWFKQHDPSDSQHGMTPKQAQKIEVGTPTSSNKVKKKKGRAQKIALFSNSSARKY